MSFFQKVLVGNAAGAVINTEAVETGRDQISAVGTIVVKHEELRFALLAGLLGTGQALITMDAATAATVVA